MEEAHNHMIEPETGITPRQKAAAVLLAMGSERASKIIAHFQPDEVRALMLASEGLKNVSQDDLVSIVDEFEEECAAGVGLMDSSIAFHSLIEEALTPEQMQELSVGPEAANLVLKKQPIWELLDKIDQEDLVEFLAGENAQAAAFVLTRIPPKRAAEIIGQLEREARQSIVANMITSRPAAKEAVNMLEEVVRERFGRAIGADKDSGSRKLVAGMLNELDMELSESLFEELSEIVEPATLQSVKSLMFRFEDIPTLDKAALSTLFDQVEPDLLTKALKDVSTDLREIVLSSLGQRTRRMLEAELEADLPVAEEDVLGARKQIAGTVLRLAGEGSLSIPAPDMAA